MKAQLWTGVAALPRIISVRGAKRGRHGLLLNLEGVGVNVPKQVRVGYELLEEDGIKHCGSQQVASKRDG